MSWLSTVVIAVITAAVGCVASGYVATLAIRWYNISGFEGGSGYYMIAFALLGLVVGLILGVVSSRAIGAMADPGFFKALVLSVGSMLVLIGIVGGVGRLQADVAPTIDGEMLMLIVEAKWPASQKESPAAVPGVSYLTLGSIVGRVQRKSERGALWKEDAKLVDGRWVVTGAVRIFTERGDRSLDIALNDSVRSGFVTRLPRRPGKEYLEWSEWYPRDGKNGPPKDSGVIYRYRVQKTSQPIRTEKLGAFEVSVKANSFQHDIADGTNTLDPYGWFDITYAGKPVVIESNPNTPNDTATVGMVAQVASEKPALIVYVDSRSEQQYCSLLVDDGGTLRQQRISDCSNGIQVEPLPSGATPRSEPDSVKPAKGRIDRHRFANNDVLLFRDAVLNTRALTVHPFDITTKESFMVPSVPPMGVAPDLKSFARYHRLMNDSGGLIVVYDVAHNRSYELPVDTKRMRWAEFKELTPAWLAHHFEWKRGPDGTDILSERANFTPIPYSGEIRALPDGHFEYRIPKGGQDIRLALLEYMQKEFSAVRDSVADAEYEYPVRVGEYKIRVASTGGNDYVLVSSAHGESASDIIDKIAKGFNALLATGRYDALFEK